MMEQLFIDVIEDRASPVMNASISDASSYSCGDIRADIDAADGVDTHEGGPNEFEYPVRTCIGFPSTSCLVVQFRRMGESCLLDRVSGTTCFLPGMCLT